MSESIVNHMKNKPYNDEKSIDRWDNNKSFMFKLKGMME